MPKISQNKTVYILGAGFSRDAYFPLQAEIIPRIYKLDSDISGEPVKFIETIFGKKYTPSLEDIFTLLDQAIANRDSLGGIVHTELDTLREKLIRSILYVFHSCSDIFFNQISSKFESLIINNNLKDYKKKLTQARSFYNSNAAYFIKERIVNGIKSDNFSIISLNWDTLIEDSIYRCKRYLHRFKIDIDYCCYTHPLTGDSKHINSFTQKSRNIFNIKVLKLHSSCNWLICPNCSRLFTGIGSSKDLWTLYMDKFFCPKCLKYSRHLSSEYPILLPFLLTPTFLKKIDQNPHINMVWHNAFVELSEASKIVFIGYSLPDADYLIRTLLKRSISELAEIDVVLTGKDSYDKSVRKNLRKYFAVERYRSFFSQHKLTIYDKGVRRYFAKIHGVNKFNDIIKEINQI